MQTYPPPGSEVRPPWGMDAHVVPDADRTIRSHAWLMGQRHVGAVRCSRWTLLRSFSARHAKRVKPLLDASTQHLCDGRPTLRWCMDHPSLGDGRKLRSGTLWRCHLSLILLVKRRSRRRYVRFGTAKSLHRECSCMSHFTASAGQDNCTRGEVILPCRSAGNCLPYGK